MYLTLILLVASATDLPVLVPPEQAATTEKVLFVDARPADAYLAGHIPGAVNLPAESLSETRGGVQGLLKSSRDLAQLLASAEVDPTRRVVVYAGMDDASDIKNAARVFWVLEYLSYPHVAVLDGGLARWKGENRPVETGQDTSPSTVSTEWYLSTKPSLLATYDEVVEAVKHHTPELMDMRAADEYLGLAKKDFVKEAGNIPGASNLPVSELLEGPYHTFKSPEALAALVKETGVAPDAAVISYCNTGRDASVGYLLFRYLGYENVSVYDGSMAEWGNRPSLQVTSEP
ncbi:MAG: sulfurtransferase [Candidatus Hydrogenedentes bacterium]|nr:sulfurtransferase [Candidatus Hydrogenedentota bacterium]